MKLFRLLDFSLLLCFVFPILSYGDQLEDAKAAIQNDDFKKAFELLQPLAEEGNVEAQTRLGAMYVNGQGVEKDLAKGLSWIMKAANQGYETARKIAFRLCLDLVNQGDTTVMYNLGYMCLNGWGGEYDTNVCMGWLENAGKIGHEKSSKMLARIYKEGMYGITPDEEKETYWSNLSAAFAAGIDGKWSLEVPGMDGQTMKSSFTFKTDGNTLRGTVHGPANTGYPMGRRTPIRNGKIDGNDFSFTVKSDLYGMKTTTDYTGTFLGDRLKLTYKTATETRKQRGSSKLKIKDTGGAVFPPATLTAMRIE